MDRRNRDPTDPWALEISPQRNYQLVHSVIAPIPEPLQACPSGVGSSGLKTLTSNVDKNHCSSSIIRVYTEARDPTSSHLYIIIASPTILQAIGQAAHNGLLFTLRKSTSVDTAGHAVAEIALEICLCFHQKREGCSKSRDPICKWNQVDAHHGKDMDMDRAF